jgi:secondary thiamine-phosphate synthase enzyme
MIVGTVGICFPGLQFMLPTMSQTGCELYHACFQTDKSSSGGGTMKSYRKELWFEIETRRGFINITPQVTACLAESGIQEGLVLCNAMHITASVFINDDERGLHHDFERWLEQLAPHEPLSLYEHNRTGEDNGDGHLKRTIMGREVVVAVTGGELDFGPWEQIFYGEFDGRRRKRVLVKIIGG